MCANLKLLLNTVRAGHVIIISILVPVTNNQSTEICGVAGARYITPIWLVKIDTSSIVPLPNIVQTDSRRKIVTNKVVHIVRQIQAKWIIWPQINGMGVTHQCMLCTRKYSTIDIQRFLWGFIQMAYGFRDILLIVALCRAALRLSFHFCKYHKWIFVSQWGYLSVAALLLTFT